MSGDYTSYHGKPLKPGQRGAIALLGLRRGESGEVEFGEIDYQHLRIATLFFDVVIYPQSTSYNHDHPDLMSLDFMRDFFDKFEFGDEDPSEILRDTLFRLDLEDPGQWTICSHGDKSFELQNAEPGLGFVVSAYQSLPVFDREVPLDLILEFKQRRKSELTRLRHEIESLGAVISKEGPRTQTSLHAIERFDQGLADYRKAMRETNWTIQIADLDLKFSWTGFVPALGTAAAGLSAGLPLSSLVGPLIGATALSVGVTSGLGLRRKNSAGPFEYLTRIRKELF